MNDLELIDRFGPAPTDVSDDALAAARARLDEAVRRGRSTAPRHRRLVAITAVAATAAGVALAPSLLGSKHALALAAVDPLTFPVTAEWVPADLGPAVFSRDSSHLQWARYGAPGPENITLIATDTWDEWEDVDDIGTVDVNGHDAHILRVDRGETHDLTVAWEDGTEIVGVTGRGTYADLTTVERMADSVVEKPQPVDLFLTVAPQGWPVMAYQSDHHISYGEHGELTVILTSTQAGDLDDWGDDWRDITVDGRPGHLGTQPADDGGTTWSLVTTAPDGREFFLRAPSSLTEQQVIEIAAGVRHR